MRHNIRILYDVPITMRDGTILYCDIYRPDDTQEYPAIVNRTPYLKDNINPLSGYIHAHKLAACGYHVVIQDVRGSAKSEGVLDPSGHQTQDGYDTVEAVAKMKGCNGKVGMVGESYHGYSQLAAAKGQPPHLAAICPFETSWTKFPAIYSFGVFSPVLYFWIYGRELDNDKYRHHLSEETKENMQKYLADAKRQLSWLPMREMPAARLPEIPALAFHRELLENITNEAYLEEIGRTEGFEQVRVPCMHLTGWNDFLRDETIYNFVSFHKRGGTEQTRTGGRLIVGPWSHGDVLADTIAGQYYGAQASGDAQDITGKIAAWFDYWMKGQDSAFMSAPPVRLFIMGINQWRDEAQWPLKRTSYQKLYLHSEGGANTLHGNGRLSFVPPEAEPCDTYLYDPANPAPLDVAADPENPYAAVIQDQRINEAREDILVYTTDVLKEALELVGPVQAQIFAASSAVDTDFVCKLLDVKPDGSVFLLMSRLVRARYRKGKTPEPLIPGKVCPYAIDVGNTGIVLQPGHRIRVEITSSIFPHADANLNTGGRVGYEETGIVAKQQVYHSAQYPSHVVLPVIPGREDETDA